MDELIAKLEAATEGSRELDGLIEIIAVQNREAWASMAEDVAAMDQVAAGLAIGDEWGRLPAYTTSLDAALTLVPSIEGYPDVAMTCAPQLTWTHTGEVFCNIHGSGQGVIVRDIGAPTPALALCIAALKARAPNPITQEGKVTR